jgi:hypothetical protein
MQLRGLRKEKHKIPVYPIAKQNPKERFLTLLNIVKLWIFTQQNYFVEILKF